MQKDKRKWTAEYIEGNVGRLTAQIVLNNLIDNGYKMWFIGNTDGNCLYTVELSNNERVVVGFTSQEIASIYVNKPEVKKTLFKMFGDKIVLVEFSFPKIHKIMNSNHIHSQDITVGSPMAQNILDAFRPDPLETIILNPSGKASFIPLNIDYMMDKIISEDLFYDDDDEDEEGQQKSAVFELYKLDKETKRYELKEISDSDSSDEKDIM
jgi:hypothetical protein|tara:strand:+ start:328 stop:957 length:630 start_codon:yes stop_codon:yes gene_type:complete